MATEEMARGRATDLRDGWKELKAMHARKPSLDDVEAFVLEAILLDEPDKGHDDDDDDDNDDYDNDKHDRDDDDENKHRQGGDNHKNQNDHDDDHDDGTEKSALSTEILFSLPPIESLTGRRAELPSHHKPAKRFSVKGLWHAHEKGYRAGALVRRQAAKSAMTTATAPDDAADAVIVAASTNTKRNETEQPLLGRDVSVGNVTTDDDDDIDDDDVASDIEVRPNSKKGNDDTSVASSWDENDHRDNYDTWEVRCSKKIIRCLLFSCFAHPK